MKILHTIILSVIFLTLTPFVYSQNELPQKSDSIVHIDGTEYYIHTVVKGETAYSLSRSYGITLETLYENNPNAVYGLRFGETLQIPVVSEQTTITPPVVGAVEKPTILSFDASDLLKSRDSICISEWNTKKKYTVALILPFAASRLAATLSSSSKKNTRHGLESTSAKYLSFYNGVKLALDSLAAKGLNICLNVYDIHKSGDMEQLLAKPEMQNTDLIIGIIYADAFKKIADFSNEHQIPLINVASSRNDILQEYPNVAKIVPDEDIVGHTAQRILPEDDNVNILIVRKSATAYSKSVERLKMLYPRHKEFLGEGKSMSSAASLLDAHKMNYVFMFSENTMDVLDVMRVFDEKRKQFDVTLIGYPNWHNINELDLRYAHNLKLHFIVPQAIDYNEQYVKDFVYMFRARFNNEPNLLAFQGYDIAYNFIYAVGTFGNNCLECFNYIRHHFLSTGDIVFDNTPGNGYNNQYWNIYTVQEYEIIWIP